MKKGPFGKTQVRKYYFGNDIALIYYMTKNMHLLKKYITDDGQWVETNFSVYFHYLILLF